MYTTVCDSAHVCVPVVALREPRHWERFESVVNQLAKSVCQHTAKQEEEEQEWQNESKSTNCVADEA